MLSPQAGAGGDGPDCGVARPVTVVVLRLRDETGGLEGRRGMGPFSAIEDGTLRVGGVIAALVVISIVSSLQSFRVSRIPVSCHGGMIRLKRAMVDLTKDGTKD